MSNAYACAPVLATAISASPDVTQENSDLSLWQYTTLNEFRERCAVLDRTDNIAPLVEPALADPAVSEAR
jgi:hypothetical protein